MTYHCDYSEDFGRDWISIPSFQFAVGSRTRVFAFISIGARYRYKRFVIIQVEGHVCLLLELRSAALNRGL